ncbi:MAG: hypothetical protein KF794_03080 [Xanthobacteraceae bacterium]|nr:hypothetical protein [Xanthobacteraceae bacterium]QYK46573.1 MAG: hypothetical protein KF794_03080 [Xanthobacteraceae bacterium]
MDNEAIAIVWRANPFPPPPSHVADGKNIQLTAPVRFIR